MNQRMNRIPTLDGWRGIAILMVVVTHLQISLLGHLYGGYRWMDLGQHGVNLFFVLSGYLITGRLLCEEKIDLRSFYLRRFFRLMPCAWAYLLTLAIASMIAHTALVGRDAWSCLFFFRNYYPQGEAADNFRTGHFWSLSLEEQFYLAWPPVLFFAGRVRAVWIAAGVAIACAVFRFLYWHSYNQVFADQRTEVRIDALLVGCLLALLLESARIRAWFQRFGGSLFWILALVLVWHIHRYEFLIPLSESLAMAAIIACTSLAPSSIAARALEWKHLKFLGLISYSLYVWQQGVLFIPLPRIGALFLAFVAILSYGLIERPCIAFGRRVVRALRPVNALAKSKESLRLWPS
jgi:peptidoglycan/LPS O-acetylase OafA/YrhL